MAELRHWYGFFLSLLTALMWGVLPVALELLLDDLNVLTITWVRFSVSAFLVYIFLRHRQSLPVLSVLIPKVKLLLLVAILALVCNFLLYLLGLDLLNPETAQILIQLAPFILMFGSVFLYGEKFGRLEWLGVALLFIGLGLFFNDRLTELFTSFSSYSLGVVCVLLASISWGGYGLLQKYLLGHMHSGQLTLLIYAGGSLTLMLFLKPEDLLGLSLIQYAALLFCCLNMVIAYGAFTEALHYWQAAKVSAVIALAPVFTIISMAIAVNFWPGVFTDSELNSLSLFGAMLVVCGSMLASLGRQELSVK
jgi:drug/metabolite transporter (DMT)-like permease